MDMRKREWEERERERENQSTHHLPMDSGDQNFLQKTKYQYIYHMFLHHSHTHTHSGLTLLVLGDFENSGSNFYMVEKINTKFYKHIPHTHIGL